jgi:hypothetical protein
MVRRIISHPLFIGTIGALVAKFLPDIFEKNWEIIMKFLYNHLWIGVWPIWVGLAIAAIYWFIRFSINVYKSYVHYDSFVKNTYLSDQDKIHKEAQYNTEKMETDFQKSVEKISKEISKWREALAEEISDLRESTIRESSEFRLSINELILKDTDFEERVNHIVDQRIIKEKQEALWENQRQQRKTAGIPDWDKWPKKEE